MIGLVLKFLNMFGLSNTTDYVWNDFFSWLNIFFVLLYTLQRKYEFHSVDLRGRSRLFYYHAEHMINTDTHNDLKGSINNTATQSGCVDLEEFFGRRTACIECKCNSIKFLLQFLSTYIIAHIPIVNFISYHRVLYFNTQRTSLSDNTWHLMVKS